MPCNATGGAVKPSIMFSIRDSSAVSSKYSPETSYVLDWISAFGGIQTCDVKVVESPPKFLVPANVRMTSEEQSSLVSVPE
jgi:hypothetical protein